MENELVWLEMMLGYIAASVAREARQHVATAAREAEELAALKV
jgi:hypothetical protein